MVEKKQFRRSLMCVAPIATVLSTLACQPEVGASKAEPVATVQARVSADEFCAAWGRKNGVATEAPSTGQVKEPAPVEDDTTASADRDPQTLPEMKAKPSEPVGTSVPSRKVKPHTDSPRSGEWEF